MQLRLYVVAVDVEEERTDGQGGALVLNWNGYSVKDGSHEMLGYAELLAGDFAVSSNTYRSAQSP